ncbi:MAG: sulfotransferase [Pleurocapsa sp. MO_226.B13]|nr:sulfotransferase [Pleurocapsa sp. MO_226.B13]
MINRQIRQPIAKNIKTSPIFIVGCDRSGTTLLRLMLNQSRVLHITAETEFLLPLQKNQAIYGDFSQPYQRYFFIRDLQTNRATSKTFTFPVFELTVIEAATALEQAAPTDFSGASQAIYQASVAKKNKQRWGDKTPHQVRDICTLAQMFPDAQFVHIIRDGRDVAISMRKAGWLRGNMLGIAEYWCRQVTAGISAGRSLDNSETRYYELYYEQLLQHPEATLQALCAWLNLEYSPQMLEYYRDAESNIQPEHSNLFELNQKPIDATRAYGWKQKLSQRDLADFESIASDLLQRLGYEIEGAKISFQIKLARTIKNSMKSSLDRLKKQFNN